MKQLRLPALALAGAMLFALSACGPKESDPTPAPTGAPEAAESVSPTTAPSEAPETTPEPAPSESMTVVTPPVETDGAVKPLETQKPVQSHPIQTLPPTLAPVPTETPAPSEAPADEQPTAADVYAAVSAVAGGNPMSDASFVLEDFYGISAGDLADFVLYMPEMNATTEEIFIAKVNSGKLDTVKAACESRQKGMKEDAAMYPSAAEYVEKSQIVTSGDWILFCVCENPDAAVSAFRDAVK